MHRKFFGSTKRRVIALFAALALLGGGGAAVASLASAAPVKAATVNFGPGTVYGALVAIPASNARGWYIDAHGGPWFLPKGPNAVYGQSGDYPGDWFYGTSLGSTATLTGTAPALTSTDVQALIDAALAKLPPSSGLTTVSAVVNFKNGTATTTSAGASLATVATAKCSGSSLDACYQLTLSGAPAFKTTATDIYSNNSAADTVSGTTVTVTNPTPTVGDTARVFYVGESGFKTTNKAKFDLTVSSTTIG